MVQTKVEFQEDDSKILEFFEPKGIQMSSANLAQNFLFVEL